MAKRNIPKMKEYINKHKKRSVRQRVFIAVAALVVFCTTYAMILPAITMEGKVNCGKEEHIHQQSCYSTEKTLVCKLEEGKTHLHEENCYNSKGDLICEASTSELHTHIDECYAEKMIMVCGKTMHEHTSACIESVQQATENVTAIAEELTSENATELSSEEISKADNSKTTVESSASDIKDLKEYLAEPIDSYGTPRGTVYHTVRDSDDKIVPDTTLVSGEGYIFSLTIEAKGILPGTYQYTLPAEIYLSDREEYAGDVSNSSGGAVGDYSAKRESTVVITITFDEHINDYQDFAGTIEFNINIDNGGEKPTDPAISKTGAFNETDGMFDFKIDAVIPAHGGNDLFREWYIFDESRVTGVGSWDQSLNDSVINITYNTVNEYGEIVEETYPVPNITKTSENDDIAYICSDITGYECLYLVNRCKCNETLCAHISEEDETACKNLSEEFGDAYAGYSEWCTCWSLDKNATLSIEYKNNKHGNGKYLLNSYPGKVYVNDVSLASDSDMITASVSVPIPDLISKNLTEKFSSDSNYRGQYTIYVNESKVDLSKVDNNNDGVADTELLITDTMSNVAYIPGSISIVATGAESSETLSYGTDYEIKYIPGSDDPSVAYNSTLNITLKKLGAYTYTIKYSGQAISNKSEGAAINLRTSNTATVSVYSYPSDNVSSSCYFKQSWSYKQRILTIEKTDIDDGRLLPGAVYGLYTEDGYEIARGTTDGVGLYDFKTNVREGIIFEEETAYYIKEIDAPDGYTLDTSLHWFYFAGEKVEALELVHAGIMLCDLDDDGSDDFNKMNLTDEKGIELPETGGCGTVIYTVAGLILICCSVYVLYKKYSRWKGVFK